MATKFISLDNLQPVKKQTKFTHYVDKDKQISSTPLVTPSEYDNVLHIGTDEEYGDVFKAWDDGEKNNFIIYFGVKGDEFE